MPVMAPTLLRPSNRDPHPTELASMIAALVQVLEDQHVFHGQSASLELDGGADRPLHRDPARDRSRPRRDDSFEQASAQL